MIGPEQPQLILPHGIQRPSGIWVPMEIPAASLVPEQGTLLVVGEPPSDLDAIWVAPEVEALGIPPVSLATVDELLAGLPFEPAMMALSVISGSTWFAGNDQSKHLSLAEEVFGTGRPIYKKLREFVAEGPNHLIFNEQHLTVLMRLLITSPASAEDGMRELTEEEVDTLLMALVGIATPIAEAGNSTTDPAQPTDWVPFLVRSVADTNNNRIQKWSPSEGTSSGVASTTIKIDGKVVDSTSPGCPAGGCSISREWTLNSSSYTPGQHVAEVIATDVAGLTSTKSLTLNIAKDTTAPQITANASLYTAPEGWVEQQSYPYTASAADPSGYGSTSLMLKIDGKTVKSASQSCPNGACEETLSGSISMASYKGGAHPAELIATDGAGNATAKKWTINVDPEGHISAEESTATLEALEVTSPTNPVGEAQEELEYEGTEAGLGVEKVAGVLEATGTQVPTTIGVKPSSGVTLEILGENAEEASGSGGSADLTPIEVVPTDTAVGATDSELVGEVAAVAADTEAHVDTIIRPLYDGAMNFEAIRDASASETFTWQVHLAEEQELKLIDEKHAEVDYAGTEHTAFSITAAPARDAIGSSVPTSLSVSGGDEVTLTVHHHAPSPAGGSFVYPVIAGAGWQGGFQTYISELPPPEPQPEEIETGVVVAIENTEGVTAMSGGPMTIGPPEFLGLDSSGEYDHRKHFFTPNCVIFVGRLFLSNRPVTEWRQCNEKDILYGRAYQSGFFHYSGYSHVWWEGDRERAVNCVVDKEKGAWKMYEKGCHFAGINNQIGANPHIVATQDWRVENDVGVIGSSAICMETHSNLYANGNVKRETKGANTVVGEGDPCNWDD